MCHTCGNSTHQLARGAMRSYSVDEDAALLVTNIGEPTQTTLVLGNQGVSLIDITGIFRITALTLISFVCLLWVVSND
jgi:hypothetical protein